MSNEIEITPKNVKNIPQSLLKEDFLNNRVTDKDVMHNLHVEKAKIYVKAIKGKRKLKRKDRRKIKRLQREQERLRRMNNKRRWNK